jgi:hypothetical protein
VDPSWLDCAHDHLRSHARSAAVAGWRQERHPERSVYNQLCEIEWHVPPGPAKSFGGDVLLRSSALLETGGYRDDLIAGEEPELCVRLRQRGWQIEVLPLPMTLHDAAMTRFHPWWRRTMRSGYAYAEGARLHGDPPERHFVRQRNSALAWSIGLPLASAAAAPFIGVHALGLWLLYPLQFMRLAAKHDGPPRLKLARASSLLIGKFAETQGILHYWRLQALGRRGRLIEYK